MMLYLDEIQETLRGKIEASEQESLRQSLLRSSGNPSSNGSSSIWYANKYFYSKHFMTISFVSCRKGMYLAVGGGSLFVCAVSIIVLVRILSTSKLQSL